VLMITVQLWLTPRGDYVSAKALHPVDVEFEVGDEPPTANHPLPEVPIGQTALGYSPKLRTLVGLRSYVRTVGKTRDVGSYDTNWRAAIPPPEGAAAVTGASLLPDEISVVNVDERVCVYRGKRPANTAEANARAEAGDLMARVPTADGGYSDLGCYELAVRPDLIESYSQHAGVLPLFLAIAIEGFWSQGAICLGQVSRSGAWQTKVENTAEGPVPALREGKNAFLELQRQNIRHAKRREREEQR